MSPDDQDSTDTGPSNKPVRGPVAEWRKDIMASLAFLTCLPLPPGWSSAPLSARAMRAFPLVGVLVGAAGGVVLALALEIGLPPLPAAALALMAQAILTGALHEDALGDMADGLGGNDPAARMAIMRDSRLGGYGVVSLILVLLCRGAAMAGLAPGGWTVILLLAAAGAVSRAAMPVLSHLTRPARTDGLAATAGPAPAQVAAQAAALAVVAAVLLVDITAAATGLAAAVLAAAAVGAVAARRIGGHTGDVLGTAQVITEVAFLLGLLIAA